MFLITQGDSLTKIYLAENITVTSNMLYDFNE